jgi:hypothetical protein
MSKLTRLLGESLSQSISELQGNAEVIELEARLDKMFSTLGLDVEFSRHFIDRILGRDESVTIETVTASFEKMKKKYKKKLLSAKKQDNWKAILKDFTEELNVVFVVEGDELKAITIMNVDPDKFYGNAKDNAPILKVK